MDDSTDMLVTPDAYMMTYQADGTYSANYKSDVQGFVTIEVFYLTSGIYTEFFSDEVFTEPPAHTQIDSIVNIDWNTGPLFSTFSDNVSMKMHFLVKAASTEDYDRDIVVNYSYFIYAFQTLFS